MADLDWEQRLAAKQAAKAAARGETAAPVVVPVAQAPLPPLEPLPEGLVLFEQSLPEEVENSDRALDNLIDGIGILDAYARWCGKMVPDVLPGQVESIMVSCPVPGHADNNPSAWINLNKGDGGLWHCMACGIGGDKWDIAAYYFNITDYKNSASGKAFHDLRREIGKSLGWTFEKDAKGFLVGLSPEDQAKKVKAAEDAVINSLPQQSDTSGDTGTQEVATVTNIDPEEEEEESQEILPMLDWRPLVRPGTFLDQYMKSCTVDTAPEEYHFWCGLQALSLSIGRNLYLVEDYDIYSNLFLCFLGSSGAGKSKARRPLESLLEASLPFDPEAPDPHGVYVMPTAGSGEMLIKLFKGEHFTSKNLPPLSKGNVKGYVNYDELSSITGRAARTGSTIKPILQGLYDTPSKISNATKTGGEDVAEMPFCNLATSAQPDALRDLLSKGDASSGFLNRFIFVTGTTKARLSRPKVRVDVSSSVPMLQAVHNWSLDKGGIDYSETAGDIWDAFFYKTLEPKITSSDSSMISRLDFILKKIMVILAANAMEDFISEETVEAAKGMYEYLLNTYLVIENKVEQSIGGEIEQFILDYMIKQQPKSPKGMPIAVKWITPKSIQRVRRKWDLDDIRKAMETLEKWGELTGMMNPPNKGRGRPITGKAYLPARMQ